MTCGEVRSRSALGKVGENSLVCLEKCCQVSKNKPVVFEQEDFDSTQIVIKFDDCQPFNSTFVLYFVVKSVEFDNNFVLLSNIISVKSDNNSVPKFDNIDRQRKPVDNNGFGQGFGEIRKGFNKVGVFQCSKAVLCVGDKGQLFNFSKESRGIYSSDTFCKVSTAFHTDLLRSR